MASPAIKGFAGLPQEIIDQICHDVNNDWTDTHNRGRLRDLNNLSRTCKPLFNGVLPILYRRFYQYRGQSCLWWACGVGRVSTVQRAISTGYASCELGHLVTAIHRKHVGIVRLLVEVPNILRDWTEGHNLDRALLQGETPLSIAVCMGNLDVIKVLLARNPADSALKRDSESAGDSALHMAVMKGDIEMATLLLSYGAPVNALATQRGYHRSSPRSPLGPLGPLHMAADDETNVDPAMVKLLIDHHADVNLEDKAGYTKLHTAADKAGFTPLYYALRRDNLQKARLLLEAGASLDNLPKNALEYAAKSKDAKMLRLVMEHGCSWDVGLLNTSLSSAAAHPNVEGVQLLLELGADPNVRTQYHRETSLHAAAQAGSAACVRLLVDAGADVNALSKQGVMPLHALLWNRNHKSKAEILKILFSAGADPDRRDPGTGWTTLHRIIQISEEDDFPVYQMMLAVLESGAKVDVLAGVQLFRHKSDSKTGVTALEYLTQVLCRRSERRRYPDLIKDEIACLKLLLEHGADPDRNANTCPISCALKHGNARVVDLLFSYGVDFQVEDGAHLKHKHHSRRHYLTSPTNLYDAEVDAWLLQKGLDVNARDPSSGRTVLHTICAAPDGFFRQRVHTLLDPPFNMTLIDAQDAQGNTALHLAVQNNRDELVRALLKRRARLRPINNDGETALEMAQRLQHGYVISSIKEAMEWRAKYPDGKPRREVGRYILNNVGYAMISRTPRPPSPPHR